MTHAGFILASYLIAVAVLLGLVAWVVLDGRAQDRRLKELEAQGVRRRSDRGGSAKEAGR